MDYCPFCDEMIDSRLVTCPECADPETQCACGAELPKGPYGLRYPCCDDCADAAE